MTRKTLFSARRLVVALAAIGLFTLTPAGPTAPQRAVAQAAAAPADQAKIEAGLAVFKKAGCQGCHGWAANGQAEGPNPQGPSLRETQLAESDIRMTVACGRPGTQMPYFSKDAYRGKSTDCYGVTGRDLGDQKPDGASVKFSADDIDAIAYYITNYVKGSGAITAAQCEFFYGAGDSHCTQYPK